MTTAKPRGSLILAYVGLFIVVLILIGIASLKATETDTNKAIATEKDVRYNALFVTVSQEVIAVQQEVGKIDTTQFATHDEVNDKVQKALAQPTAYCIWSEPDATGQVTVYCKNSG